MKELFVDNFAGGGGSSTGIEMAIGRSVDIAMRMLQPRELFNAQGFPADYVIDTDADGNALTRENQVARCGNAVTPPVPAALVRANLGEYCGKIERTTA